MMLHYVLDDDVPRHVALDELVPLMEARMGLIVEITDDPTLPLLDRATLEKGIKMWENYGKELQARNAVVESFLRRLKEATTPVYENCMECGRAPGHMLPSYADGFEVIKCTDCWMKSRSTDKHIAQTLSQ